MEMLKIIVPFFKILIYCVDSKGLNYEFDCSTVYIFVDR